MSLDFICGKSFLVKGTARVRAITAAGTLEDQQGGHSDRVREVRSGGRTVDLDSKCEGKPVYKEETGPNKIIHFTKITLTAE